ncbi:MAG: 50S ribosomal protein L23 [Deltaproteobacteria bacterium]|nr:50S ribosomal protein L23 [Deltaproteobacteria bacterium]
MKGYPTQKDIYSIIKLPLVSEKSTAFQAVGSRVAFWVDNNATKSEIKDAVEKLFNVKVSDVRTLRMPGKTKRVGRFEGKRQMRKKAYITLRQGDSIDLKA